MLHHSSLFEGLGKPVGGFKPWQSCTRGEVVTGWVQAQRSKSILTVALIFLLSKIKATHTL